MTEKAKEIKELINKCYLGKELEKAFTEAFEGSGQKITDEMYEMYVYVLDAEGMEKLEALANQYLILKEVSDNNFSKFKEVFDNVEPFFKKILYLIDPVKLEEFVSDPRNGLTVLCKRDYIGLIESAYYRDTNETGRFATLKKVIEARNNNTHWAPLLNPTEIGELIWQSLFVEFWAVRKFIQRLKEEQSKDSVEDFRDILIKYRKIQMENYETEINGGFKYIQIEYENTEDPEKDYEDVDFEVIKGTAATLMSSIDFEKTPSIKLVAEAGMGKTKMLEHINYMLMKEFSADNEKSVFPFLIYCNDTTGDLLNYSFLDTVYNKLSEFLKDNNFKHISERSLYNYMLANYKVLFLVDGLNEITSSSTNKSKFIKLFGDHISKNAGKKCYYLMTERYSRNAITIKGNVSFYKLSEISDAIKMEFFKAKGAEKLFERLELISKKYDADTQKELNALLRRPFYLTVFCDLSDSLKNTDDDKMPKEKYALMNLFVKRLIKRENDKGEPAANYTYVRYYLEKLAELLPGNHRVQIRQVIKGFAEVTTENGLSREEYSSNRILELFHQLGFLSCVDDEWIYVDDIYAEYMTALATGIVES